MGIRTNWRVRYRCVCNKQQFYIADWTFDGMRKHLAEEFNALYLLNLGGNMRKGQGDSNVFGITVGVSIALLVKTGKPVDSSHIFYNNETELSSKEQTFQFS